MRCPRCRSSNPDANRFCAACGAPIDPSNAPTMAADQADATSASGAPTRVASKDSSEPTRLAGTPAHPARTPAGGAGGWLTSSGSIDHGQFEPGTIVDGRYRIIGLLGRGGMGEVYRADDLRLGQPVALKLLPPSLASDAARLTQFHSEVRIARQVSHANVCRVYDIGDVDGRLYLSMEYVDGEDLSSLLRRIGRLPEDKALDVARQICAGLAAAHDRGVLHRDLKPANIMIDGTGKARIMDFSLAAVGEVTDVRSGTPAYMAPEQLAGREVTPKSDIYALGLVLYELFTGRRVFDATTLADLVAQRDSGSITAPTTIVRTLDPAIERAILRCLDPDPARRPASALAVSAALPGGDPLAAALAAGETPSPEMVAAAGGDTAVISSGAGMVLVAVTLALVVAAAAVSDRIGLLSKISLPKSAPVLFDRAGEIRRSLGYTDRQGDEAGGFLLDQLYLNWAAAQGAGATHWAVLASGRPSAMRFWERSSPHPLIPFNSLASPTFDDPPLLGTGMTEMQVDTMGRLLAFRAAPPDVEKTAAPGTTDWTPLLAAAGFDPATLSTATPARTPPMYADERRAWRGRVPGTTIDVQLEAAAYRGRPVYLTIVTPWSVSVRDSGGPTSNLDNRSVTGVVSVLLLLTVAAVLARRNIQSGRADRRGAFRIATVMFALREGIWVLAPHVADANTETNRLFSGISLALFIAGAMYLTYLALEPFIRRSWPSMLVGWSRALVIDGRDPIVGRDALVGICAGAALAALAAANEIVPRLLGHPDPLPRVFNLDTLMGMRAELLTMFSAADNGIQNALITVLVIATSRAGAQRALSGRQVPAATMDRFVLIGGTVLFSLTQIAGHTASEQLSSFVFAAATTFLALWVILRIGLLAAVVMSFTDFAIERAPLTLDPNQFYTSAAWGVIASVVGAALLALWFARTAPLASLAKAEGRRQK